MNATPSAKLPMPEAAAQVKFSVDAIWQRNRPLILERVRYLVRAAAAARLGTLTPALAETASDSAHKLAGSLGMFGYTEGSMLARAFEEALAEGTSPDARTLSSLSDALNSLFDA